MTIDQDRFEKEIEINNSSAWHLSECLKKHPLLEGKYQKILSDAIKELDRLTLELEIVTAETAEEIFKKAEEEGNPIPASGKDSILKTQVKLNLHYQQLRKEVMEAKHRVGILKGFVKGFDSRGYRLAEICKLEEKKMRGDATYYETENVEYGKSKKDKFKSVDTRIEEIGEILDFGEGD